MLQFVQSQADCLVVNFEEEVAGQHAARLALQTATSLYNIFPREGKKSSDSPFIYTSINNTNHAIQ